MSCGRSPAGEGKTNRRMDCMSVAPDSMICGINASAVGEIEPRTRSAARIADEGGRFLAADGSGGLYFAGGPRYQIRAQCPVSLQQADGACVVLQAGFVCTLLSQRTRYWPLSLPRSRS